jgi:hypothetical protein
MGGYVIVCHSSLIKGLLAATALFILLLFSQKKAEWQKL